MTPTTAALQLSSELDKDSHGREDAIQAIASSYLTRGDYEAAIAALSTLEPPIQAQYLHYVAVVAAKAGHNDQARTALNVALKLILADAEDSRDSYWIRDFTLRAIEVDDLKLASRFVDTLEDYSPRKAQALLALAQAQAKRGEHNAAIATIDGGLKQLDFLVEDDLFEFFALVPPITKLLFELGRKEKAAELLRLAEITPVPDDDPNSARYKTFLSSSYANIGAFAHASSIAESIEGQDRIASVITLALAYGNKGDDAAALAWMNRAREIAESEDDDYGFRPIVTAYLKLGRPDEAFAALRQIHNQYALVESAIAVAHAYHARKRDQEAIAALNTAFRRVRELVSEKSEEIPGSASTSLARQKSAALSRLALEYLSLGDLPSAEAAAGAIDQPQYRASLLSQVASAYYKRGDQAKAKSLLSRAFNLSVKSPPYNHDLWRSKALLRIAEDYAEAGFKREAEGAVLSFLRELQDEDTESLIIPGLMEIGRVCEEGGILLNKNAQSVLMQLVKKYKG